MPEDKAEHLTQAQKDAWHQYSLASFLLGNTGTSFFTFSYAEGNDPTATYGLWTTELGAPVEAYRKSNGTYQRRFANGLVLVNPTSSTVRVPVSGTYRDLSGASVTSSATLSPHSGTILRKA